MTYAQFGLIQATDYGTTSSSGFVGCVNAMWGTGTAASLLGYGQTDTLSPVAASDTISASQWSTLIARLNSISRHQTGSPTGLPNTLTTGDVITYLNTLTSTISSLTSAAQLATAAAVGTQVNVATPMTNTTVWTGGLPGTNGVVKEARYSWPNADAMRYFFNAGGYVSFTGANSALAGNTKSDDWDALLVACGVIRIKANTSEKVTGTGSGTPSVINTNLGFYDLGTAYGTNTLILRQYSTTATGGYNLNYANFEAKLDAAASSGAATQLFLRMTLYDGATDTSGVPDQVTGTVQLDYSYTPPATSWINNSWGTVTAFNVPNGVTNTQS
jgi:hypothetical protein